VVLMNTSSLTLKNQNMIGIVRQLTIRNVYNDSIFTTSVLQILIEESRLLHQRRQNQGKTELSVKVGDVVKVYIPVISNSVESSVKKLL